MMRVSLSVTSLYVLIKSGPVCTSISDFYDMNSNMEYQHLCGACEYDTAFFEVSDDFTSKLTVNMTKYRNFALKETDLCKICFVYMCKFTWGYGQTKLVRAAVGMNFVFKTFKTFILLHNLEQNNRVSVH